jgi:hypothetical protein
MTIPIYTKERTNEVLKFEGIQFMQINKSMKTAQNNNKQQEAAKQIGAISNQKKNTDNRKHKTVDTKEAVGAHIQQQQITESDVEGSKIKIHT